MSAFGARAQQGALFPSVYVQKALNEANGTGGVLRRNSSILYCTDDGFYNKWFKAIFDNSSEILIW